MSRASLASTGSSRRPAASEQRQRFVATVRGERDPRAHQVDPCSCGVVERYRLRSRHERQGVAELAGMDLQIGAVERTSYPPHRVGRQRSGLLEEGGRCRHTAVGQGAAGRPLELRGHRLVRVRGRASAMPCAAIGIDVRIGDVGERPVHLPPLGRRRRPVDGRPDEGVPEPGMVAQLDQAGGLGRARRFRSDAETVYGAPQQRNVADRFGGCRQEQLSGLPRQRCQLAEEALFEAVDQRGGTGGADRAERQLGRRQPPRQLQEGERVAMALGQDAVPDPRVERAGHRRVQELAGVAAAQPVHPKLREPGQDGFLVGLADREHHGHGFDPQTAGDELQRLHRRPVQPLGVVHDTEQGQFLGNLAEQGQDGQSHQEAVGRGAGRSPKAVPRASRCGSGAAPAAPRTDRRAGAGRRRQAPSRTRHRQRGRPGSRPCGREGTRATPSCRSRPPHAAPGPGYGPPSRRRRGRSVSRIRVLVPADPATIGTRRYLRGSPVVTATRLPELGPSAATGRRTTSSAPITEATDARGQSSCPLRRLK